MISDIFYYKVLKHIKNIDIYEEEIVLFYLKLQLQDILERENKGQDKIIFSKKKIEELLEKIYVKQSIKSYKILNFCNQNFLSEEKNYILKISKEEKEIYKKIKEYESELEKLKQLKTSELYEILEKEIKDKTTPFESKLKKYITYYCWKNEFTYKENITLLYRYYYILKNYSEIYRNIEIKLEKIPELFDILEIPELNITEQQKNFLIHNNIFTFKKLKHFSLDSLICIFSNDIESFIKEIEKYGIDKQEILQKLDKKFKNELKPERAIVLQKRVDLKSNQKRTLTDIGRELNLSKERIRQVEQKAIQNLLVDTDEINKLLYYFFKDINKNDKNFITIEELLEYIGDEILTKYLIIILENTDGYIELNEEYGILYNSKETTFEKILNEEKSDLKDIMILEDTEKFDKIQKNILKNNYKIYQNKILVKKSISNSYIYVNEIKENFINGYDIGSEEDYNKLIKIINGKYGDIEKIPSMRSIQAIIERMDFVQIDRGKYKAKDYALILNEELIEKIIKFIIENAPIISYSLIFEEFKQELKEIGIDNRFYLKGVLDEKLPENFKKNRDFININSEENVTTYELIRKTVRSFEGEFTIEDIEEKIPGLKGYNCENYIISEEENGLIRVSTKTYIYIENLKITEETKKQLKEYIDYLFEKMDSKVLTSRKIYASLSIMNKELLNKLHITSRFGHFELFSIIQYLYKNEYYYSRPNISLEKNAVTSNMLIKEYIKRLEKFNYADVKNYLYKMNIHSIYSYLNFMEELSDEYIQISKDTMIKKEKLELTEEKLNPIKEFMDLALKEQEIVTNNFDGYYMLPKINRTWNKYLLVGIIRTYFKDEYEVENTTNSYDSTDFIIRRIN